jgi:hypothetical protein
MRVRFAARAINIPLHHSVLIISEAQPDSAHLDAGIYFFRGKAAEVLNYTSSPPYIIVVWRLI